MEAKAVRTEVADRVGSPVRRCLKAFFYGIALALVSPLVLGERLARALMRRDVWFQFHGETLSLFPGTTGAVLRNAYLHWTLRDCPMGCCFCFGTMFTHSEAEVGNRVFIGGHSSIGLATIEDDTMLADHVHILSGRRQHETVDPTLPFQDQPQTFTRIHIGRNCWVGTNTVVMADIGENCIIGAGSVVTRPVPNNSVAVGNPARVIRSTYSSTEFAKVRLNG
jgi:acetyltransferase-like isoleucine patch superfamily enzyme